MIDASQAKVGDRAEIRFTQDGKEFSGLGTVTEVVADFEFVRIAWDAGYETIHGKRSPSVSLLERGAAT